MKRIFSACLALILLIVLAIPAAAQGGYLYDNAGLLTNESRQKLENLAQEVSRQNGCGVYFMSVPDYQVYGKGSVFETAVYLYESAGLGMGENKDGVLLLLSMADRDYALIAHGFGDTALTDSGKDYITDHCLGDFGDDDWYYGIQSYITSTDTLLNRARNGDVYDRNKVGSGEAWLMSLLLGAALSLIVCLIGLLVQKKKVKEQTQALGYLKNGGVHITRRTDRYTHTTETRHKIETNNSSSGGSSYHHSGGYSGKSGKF